MKDKSKCAACGTSPVNHTLLLVLSFLDSTLGRIDKPLLPLAESALWNHFIKFIFFISYCLGIIRYNSTDPEKAPIGRSKIVWQEAQRRGIHMEQVIAFGRPTDHYRAKIEGKWFYFNSIPVPPTLPQRGYHWIDDKLELAQKLEKINVPAPKTRLVRTLHQATKAFAELEKPIILKPQSGSRGRHTTTNIRTLDEMEKAYKLARQITTAMVMQEHLHGSVYRATVVDNKLVGFFRADQPEVIGDGARTIGQLIADKNKNKPERVSDIEINDDLKSFISRYGYNTESILPVGEKIILSAKTGRMYGSYTREMLPEIHPKLHSIFQNATESVEGPVMGFDLIIEDPKADPDSQRWGIIECNSLPFIDLHYFALEGPRINVAEDVWDLWKK